MKANGFDFSPYLVINKISRPTYSVENVSRSSNSMNGSKIVKTKLSEANLIVEVTLISDKENSFMTLNEIEELLKDKLINTEEEIELIFSDRPDRYYLAKLDGANSIDVISRSLGTLVLNFNAPAGLSYAVDENKTPMNEDIISVENHGTYKAPVKFSIDFPADCESIGLVTEDRIAQFGYTVSEDIDEDLSNIVLFNDPMKSSTSGQYTRNAGKPRWRNDSGDNTTKIQGDWKYESDAITPSSYGPSGADDAFWHGPTITRYFEAFPDGSIEGRINFKPNGSTKDRAKKQGLTELNFLDADNHFVAGIELKDNTDQKYLVEYKFYVGDAVVKSGNLPSSVLTKNGGFFGLAKIEKVGNLFKFYLARLVDKTGGGFNEFWVAKHEWTNEETAMLMPVRFDYGAYNWRNKQAMYQSLTNIKVTRYATRNDKLLPKTFIAGDHVDIDEDFNVWVNGILDNGYCVNGSKQIFAEKGVTEIYVAYESEEPPIVEASVRGNYL